MFGRAPFGRPPAPGPPFGFSSGHMPPGPGASFLSRFPSAQFTPRCDQGSSHAVEQPAHLQRPWSATPCESSEQAGEEFLRCIADNKPLPDYLKRTFAGDVKDVMKSTLIVKKVEEFHKLMRRRKSTSRGRSRGRSRCKSVYRSRSKSPGSRGRSRGRSKSRERRCRSKSRKHSRSKSCARKHSRSKSCARKKSRSQSRAPAPRAKSQSRVMKRSHSRSHSSTTSPARSVIHKLMQVVSRKRLEDVIHSIQAAGGVKTEEHVSSEQTCVHQDEEESDILPHDRVGMGSDFSWLQTNRNESVSSQKVEKFDEELFLYGNGLSLQTSEHSQAEETLKSFRVDPKLLLKFSSVTQDSLDCETIRDILKSVGAVPIINDHKVKTEEQKHPRAGPTASCSTSSKAQPSGIKATKEQRSKSDGLYETSKEQKSREMRARMNQMDLLIKEIQQLQNQDGLGYLTPVFGFYCQKCEEFVGDLSCVEKHVLFLHSEEQKNQRASNSKGHPNIHGYHGYHRDGERRDCKGKSLHSELKGPEERLKEEMKQETMLITVSRGQTPPPGRDTVPGRGHKGSSKRKDRESRNSSDRFQRSRSKKKKKKKKKKSDSYHSS
ncbi:uncharacterized protein LOC114477139 [Gouania willdenowi]|uniref:uncharacterized protein LOC114477139 n=1 Tax=Gouania willdenowi TaxID=441366 RepID=UPI001056018E|nr:uncharacterized protein LOC114477139 [Gouania willdenowi]